VREILFFFASKTTIFSLEFCTFEKTFSDKLKFKRENGIALATGVEAIAPFSPPATSHSSCSHYYHHRISGQSCHCFLRLPTIKRQEAQLSLG